MNADRWRSSAVVVGLVLATFIAFWPVHSHDFVNYDDDDYVTANPHVQNGLTWRGAGWAFGSLEVANWHPVTWLSHMVDVQVFGVNAGSHHLMNVALHAVNVVLLYLVLFRMTGVWWRCAVVAGLFALHPLHVESVAWISERKDLLSTAFGLLTIAAYIRWVQAPSMMRMFMAIGCFGLSLMSKPMLVTLPFVLMLLDIWPLRRIDLKEEQRWQRLGCSLIEKWSLLILSMLSCTITIIAQRSGGAVGEMQALPLDARIGNAVVSYVLYLRDAVWPMKLAVLYPHPHHIPFGEVVLEGGLLLAITLWCFWLLRRNPAALVGWLWFLGTLVPVIGLVQVGEQARADRYTYVPLIGVFIMVVWALPEPRRVLSHGLAAALVAIALAACMLASRHQLQFWRDSVSLFERALAVTTSNPTAHVNLGFALFEEDRAKAASQLNAALAIDPNYAEAHQGLGYLASGQGDTSAALRHYSRAVAIQPGNGDMRDNLGFVLVQLGRVDEALDQFAAAIESGWTSADLHLHYGAALAMTGRHAEAAEQARLAIEFNPDNIQGHLVLADSLLMISEAEMAITHYRIAIDLARRMGDDQLAERVRSAMTQRGLVAP